MSLSCFLPSVFTSFLSVHKDKKKGENKEKQEEKMEKESERETTRTRRTTKTRRTRRRKRTIIRTTSRFPQECLCLRHLEDTTSAIDVMEVERGRERNTITVATCCLANRDATIGNRELHNTFIRAHGVKKAGGISTQQTIRRNK